MTRDLEREVLGVSLNASFNPRYKCFPRLPKLPASLVFLPVRKKRFLAPGACSPFAALPTTEAFFHFWGHRVKNACSTQQWTAWYLRGTTWQPARGQQVAKSLQKNGDSAASAHGGEGSWDMSEKENPECSFWRCLWPSMYMPSNSLTDELLEPPSESPQGESTWLEFWICQSPEVVHRGLCTHCAFSMLYVPSRNKPFFFHITSSPSSKLTSPPRGLMNASNATHPRWMYHLFLPHNGTTTLYEHPQQNPGSGKNIALGSNPSSAPCWLTDHWALVSSSAK